MAWRARLQVPLNWELREQLSRTAQAVVEARDSAAQRAAALRVRKGGACARLARGVQRFRRAPLLGVLRLHVCPAAASGWSSCWSKASSSSAPLAAASEPASPRPSTPSSRASTPRVGLVGLHTEQGSLTPVHGLLGRSRVHRIRAQDWRSGCARARCAELERSAHGPKWPHEPGWCWRPAADEGPRPSGRALVGAWRCGGAAGAAQYVTGGGPCTAGCSADTFARATSPGLESMRRSIVVCGCTCCPQGLARPPMVPGLNLRGLSSPCGRPGSVGPSSHSPRSLAAAMRRPSLEPISSPRG
jgi:hypothetical protein